MYVGIEGSSYVGKTTTVEHLSKIGYGTIPEYDTYGPFPRSTETIESLKNTIDELIEREKRRTALVDFSSSSLIFADRTPFSLITFEDMKIASSPNSLIADVHKGAKDYAITKINQLSEQGDIVLPDQVAILRMNDKPEFEKRVNKRGVTAIGELAVFATQIYISEKVREYAELLTPMHSGEIVVVDHKEPADIAQNLVDFAMRPLQ